MLQIQYDLFEDPEIVYKREVEKRIEEIKISSDKVRKGTYARIGALTKECNELRNRLEILERNICQK